MSVQLQVLRLDPEARLPVYAHPGDAGADVCASADVELEPGRWAAVPTGLALAVPEGWAVFLHPRSGLAARHGVGMVNAPGTVDSGYRGEVKVLLINHGDQTVPIRRGDRIAQLVVQQVATADVVEVDALPASVRGEGGFGSTGGFGGQ